MASTPSPLVELASDWLDYKRLRENDRQSRSGASHRARRLDLCRWGRLINLVCGRETPEWSTPFHLEVDLAECTLENLNVETLQRALAAARSGSLQTTTVRRMTVTLRSFTRWLNARGYLRTDPCADEVFTIPAVAHGLPRALDAEQITALLEAAATAPPPRSRGLWWPERDVALVSVAAQCGLRAEEICSAVDTWLDTRAERPVLHVVGKGDKPRDVPVGHTTMTALERWFEVRDERLGKRRGATPLFVRSDGTPLPYQTLDRIIRGLADRSGVVLPRGSATHSLRHHFGSQLALRGVHVSIIQQLMGHADPRTTSIYTRLAATQLIAALDDAGWL